MGSTIESAPTDEISASLSRIVGDPARVDSLHELLGPFSHKSRNILNCLKMSLYLARHDQQPPDAVDWDNLERAYLKVEQLFDRLQSICRPMPLTLVRLSLSLLIEDRAGSWRDRYAARERSLEIIPPGEEDVGDFDPQSLGQALDTFVIWRAQAVATGDARLRWWTERGLFHLEWTDAGVGSVRSDGIALVDREPMALPYLARVVAAHRGAMDLPDSSGRHVHLSWPQFAANPH